MKTASSLPAAGTASVRTALANSSSLDGLYIMTENGPTWKAQSEALAAYVIEHQTVSQLADENGYAKDAIASVSINVSGFINGINECLKQAAA